MAIRLVDNISNKVESSREFPTAEFLINADARAFTALSSSIYSRKVRAVIRELSTNAFDAHVAAGTLKKPFVITLPTSWEPTFKIRDFGIGLSESDMMTMYRTYFKSGDYKLKSNDYTGVFGLGSKSPFSYTKSFQIASYYGGVKSVYTAHVGEHGVPQISKIAEEPSTAHNGLEIVIPVHSGDAYQFQSEASDLFRYFTLKPKIEGVSGFTIPTITYILNGEKTKWGMRVRDSHGAQAIMGNIFYPIDPDEINGLSDAQSELLATDIDIEFSVGDLNPTLSRERLEYDTPTIKSLKKRLDEIIEEITASVNSQVSHCKSLWEAKCFMADMFRGADAKLASLARFTNSKMLTWNNQPIGNHMVRFGDVDGLHIWIFEKREKRRRYHRSGDESTRIGCRKDDTKLIHAYGGDKSYIYEMDTEKGAFVKCENLIKSRKHDVVYLVQFTNPEAKKVFLETCGMVGSEIVPASSIPAPPKQYYRGGNGVRAATSKMFKYVGGHNPSYNRQYTCWKEETVELSQGGVYVEMLRYAVIRNSGEIKPYLLGDYYSHLIKLNPKLVIYGVRRSVIEKFRKSDNWVSLWDHVEQVYGSVMNDTALLQCIADAEERENAVNYNRLCDLSASVGNRVTDGGVAHIMIENFKEVRDSGKSVTRDKLDAYRWVAHSAGKEFKINLKPLHVVDSLWKKIVKTYPMLTYIDSFARNKTDVEGYLQLVDQNGG